MNWFKRLIYKWSSEGAELREEEIYAPSPVRRTRGSAKLAMSESREINNNGFNFKVHKANGGTIIEMNKYDEVNDRHKNAIYVIMDDKDLGEELSKIITVEGLR